MDLKNLVDGVTDKVADKASEGTVKGRLWWLPDVLEVLIVVIFGFIMFGGSHSIAGAFSAMRKGFWFITLATIVVAVMCFLPAFTSKANKKMAIFDLVWAAWMIYSLLTD